MYILFFVLISIFGIFFVTFKLNNKNKNFYLQIFFLVLIYIQIIPNKINCDILFSFSIAHLGKNHYDIVVCRLS